MTAEERATEVVVEFTHQDGNIGWLVAATAAAIRSAENGARKEAADRIAEFFRLDRCPYPTCETCTTARQAMEAVLGLIVTEGEG